ncbi:MAG: hypothetical protein ACK56I_10325, partial [bacterium]
MPRRSGATGGPGTTRDDPRTVSVRVLLHSLAAVQAGGLGSLLRLADLPFPHLGLEQFDRLRQRNG